MPISRVIFLQVLYLYMSLLTETFFFRHCHFDEAGAGSYPLSMDSVSLFGFVGKRRDPATSLTGMKIRSSYIIRKVKLVLTAELLVKLDFTNVKSTLFLPLLAIRWKILFAYSRWLWQPSRISI